jgi:hypothetical protein
LCGLRVLLGLRLLRLSRLGPLLLRLLCGLRMLLRLGLLRLSLLPRLGLLLSLLSRLRVLLRLRPWCGLRVLLRLRRFAFLLLLRIHRTNRADNQKQGGAGRSNQLHSLFSVEVAIQAGTWTAVRRRCSFAAPRDRQPARAKLARRPTSFKTACDVP